jgi:hypothetical protein
MDHRDLAENCLGQGNVTAAIAHALIALVDEFRNADEPIDYVLLGDQ